MVELRVFGELTSQEVADTIGKPLDGGEGALPAGDGGAAAPGRARRVAGPGGLGRGSGRVRADARIASRRRGGHQRIIRMTDLTYDDGPELVPPAELLRAAVAAVRRAPGRGPPLRTSMRSSRRCATALAPPGGASQRAPPAAPAAVVVTLTITSGLAAAQVLPEPAQKILSSVSDRITGRVGQPETPEVAEPAVVEDDDDATTATETTREADPVDHHHGRGRGPGRDRAPGACADDHGHDHGHDHDCRPDVDDRSEPDRIRFGGQPDPAGHRAAAASRGADRDPDRDPDGVSRPERADGAEDPGHDHRQAQPAAGTAQEDGSG